MRLGFLKECPTSLIFLIIDLVSLTIENFLLIPAKLVICFPWTVFCNLILFTIAILHRSFVFILFWRSIFPNLVWLDIIVNDEIINVLYYEH